MSGLRESTSSAPVPTGTPVVNVRGIQVTYKKDRPNCPVSIKIKTGEHAEYRSPNYATNDEVIWTFEKEFPTASQFTITVREHRTFRKLHVLDRTISASDMAVRPTLTLDESKNIPIVITIWSISAGLLSELSRRLVEDAQHRLREMKTFVEGLAIVCDRLGLIVSVTEPVSYAHPAAMSAINAAKSLIEMCRNYQECHDTASTLMTDIAGFFTFTEIPVERLKCTATEQTVQSLLMTFAKIATLVMKFSSDTVVGCLVCERLEEINAYKEELKMLKEAFDWCVKTETWRTVVRIEMHTENHLLTLLCPVRSAFYDSDRSCFERSRRDTLQQIEHWSTSGSKLFWLTGPKGYGKSVIAHTVAQILDDRGCLAGCFFCDANEGELRTPERIIPTLAYQLAKWHEGYRSIVLDTLHGPKERNIHQNIRSQFDILLKGPLKKLSDEKLSKYLPPAHKPLIIVLDAVDECRDSEFSRRPLCDYISDIAILVPWLKVMVTSLRSEGIERNFHRIQFQHLDIDDPSLDLRHDIAAYAKLCDEQTSSNRSTGLENAVRGLFSRISSSLLELKAIKNVDISASENCLCNIDAFYHTLIRGAMEHGRYEEDKREVVRDILAVASCLESIRTPTWDALLSFFRSFRPDITSEKLHNLVSSLSPLMMRGSGNTFQVLVPHVEFLEFMSDRQRSEPFWVDINTMKSRLALHCLDIVHEQVRFNICGLESSHLKNTEVPDLECRIKTCISGPLRYCCLEWMEMIMQSKSEAGPNLSESVQSLLCSPKALFWIEVLSLIGALEEGKDVLSRCMEYFKENTQICATAKELYKFVSTHQTAMELSTPHIYISVWLTAGSSLATRLSLPIAHRSRFALERPAEPDSVTERIDSEQDVHCFAYSPDRKKIVTGHWSGKLKTWDGRTGELVCGRIGPMTFAISAAFSPDGTRIVSGTRDGILRVWNALSGKSILGPLTSPNESAVTAVSYSPDGNRIASGHKDGRVLVWDSSSGDVIVTSEECHGDVVHAVVYSPDGNRIVSGSRDETLRIWSGNTGRSVGQPLRGHEHRVCCVAYSPDGTRIVSGSWDNTARIWDAPTGRPIGEPLKCHKDPVWDVRYSRDGTRIYTSSRGEIWVWDAKDGRLLNIIHMNEQYWDPEKQCFVSIPTWWPKGEPRKAQSLVYSANLTTVPDDGWIRTLDGGLLLWVPLDHRGCVCHPVQGSAISTDKYTKDFLRTEWRKLPHGSNWTRIMAVEGMTQGT